MLRVLKQTFNIAWLLLCGINATAAAAVTQHQRQQQAKQNSRNPCTPQNPFDMHRALDFATSIFLSYMCISNIRANFDKRNINEKRYQTRFPVNHELEVKPNDKTPHNKFIIISNCLWSSRECERGKRTEYSADCSILLKFETERNQITVHNLHITIDITSRLQIFGWRLMLVATAHDYSTNDTHTNKVEITRHNCFIRLALVYITLSDRLTTRHIHDILEKNT